MTNLPPNLPPPASHEPGDPPPPPRDELDALLRAWHARPSADADHRSRLLSVLEAEDTAAGAPASLPFPRSGTIHTRPIFPTLLRFAGVAATLLIVGTVTYIALRPTPGSRVPVEANQTVALAKKSEARGADAPTLASGAAATAGSEVADVAYGRASASDTESTRVGMVSEATVAAAPAPPAEAAAVAPASSAPTTTIAASPDAASEPQSEDESQLLSSRARRVLSPDLQQAAIRNVLRNNTVQMQVESRHELSPTPTPTSATASPQKTDLAPEPDASASKEKLADAPAQTKSGAPQSAAPASAAPPAAASPTANVGSSGTGARASADDGKGGEASSAPRFRSKSAAPAASPAPTPAPVQQQTRADREQASRAPQPSQQSPARSPGNMYSQTANAQSANQAATANSIPVILRLNRTPEPAAELVLRQLGVSNLRSLNSANTAFEADASEDWLLILAELEIIDRVEQRPAPAQPQSQTPQNPAQQSPAADQQQRK